MPTKQELAAFRTRLLEAVQLLERRAGKRLNQTELAGRWDVSQGSVSQWLAGKSMPEERDILKRIAKDCGVDPGWLDWGPPPPLGSLGIPMVDESAYPVPPELHDGAKKRKRGNG